MGSKKTAFGIVDFKKYPVVMVIQDQETAVFATTVTTLPFTPHEALGWSPERQSSKTQHDYQYTSIQTTKAAGI